MDIHLKRSPNFQLGLEIERGYDRRAPPLCSSYRAVKNGLRENIGDRYILYGLWNRLFGCWTVSAKSPITDHQEIVPRWPILLPARARVQADQMSVLRHLNPFPDRQVVLGKKSNLHFSQYLDSIPTVMQNLCRPFGQWQWLTLDMIRQVQGFMWFMLGERQAGRMGYVGACLSGIYESGRLDRMSRRKFGEAIMLKSRRDVLSKLYNEPISRSAVRLIENLPASIAFSDVKHLLNLLSDDRSARALQQAEEVSVELIEAMLDLPVDFRSPNVSTLVREGVSASGLENAISTACDLLSGNEHVQAVREFRCLRDRGELDGWAAKWNEIGRQSRAYPPPPIDSVPPLKPITSYAELKREGLAMRNCVASYIDEILLGDVYFYHWDGDEPATVCVVSTPGGGWFVEQALGYRNQALSKKTSQLIEHHWKMSIKDCLSEQSSRNYFFRLGRVFYN